jgi:hypothetical protein
LLAGLVSLFGQGVVQQLLVDLGVGELAGLAQTLVGGRDARVKFQDGQEHARLALGEGGDEPG